MLQVSLSEQKIHYCIVVVRVGSLLDEHGSICKEKKKKRKKNQSVHFLCCNVWKHCICQDHFATGQHFI